MRVLPVRRGERPVMAMTASDHLLLEVAAARRRGRPLDPGQPVPLCTCEACTRIAAPPVERPAPGGTDLPPLPVEEARGVPITAVAERLGIEHRRGWARCPFHEDGDPSFHLNDSKGAAFCNPCGKSWDGIALAMEMRGLTFAEAVKWITGTLNLEGQMD